MSHDNVAASLDAAERALAQFAASLDSAGFGAGAEAYQKMSSILLGQWLWVAEQPERDLDGRFKRVAALAERVATQLRPYVESMDRLSALRGLVPERRGSDVIGTRDRILEALSAAERPMSLVEIRAATRESTTTVRRDLARLIEAGHVVLAGGARPRYGLPGRV